MSDSSRRPLVCLTVLPAACDPTLVLADGSVLFNTFLCQLIQPRIFSSSYSITVHAIGMPTSKGAASMLQSIDSLEDWKKAVSTFGICIVATVCPRDMDVDDVNSSLRAGRVNLIFPAPPAPPKPAKGAPDAQPPKPKGEKPQKPPSSQRGRSGKTQKMKDLERRLSAQGDFVRTRQRSSPQ